VQEHAALGVRYNYVIKRLLFAPVIGLVVVGLVWALQGKHTSIRPRENPAKTTGVASDSESGWNDDNVRAVQMKLRDGGFYSGEIDGAYSSELALALTRYQIRNGLPITGRLDVDTSEALGAKPAVTTASAGSAQSSETWRRLRKRQGQNLAKTNAPETSSAGLDQTMPARAAESPSPPNVTTERLRDYVGAFVLAGLDPQVGAEVDFFADRVQYYDDGVMSREKIRRDLRQYAARWPERRFWLAGDIAVKPQNGNRVRVTFPLRYELRKGAKHSSGQIDKTLLVEPVGDDLQIVAVNERKAE
jgi:peptidoglycan hydrolase-like protein with peptidoglycan-binding domain